MPRGKNPFAVWSMDRSFDASTLLGLTEALSNSTLPDGVIIFYLNNISLGEATHVAVTLFLSKESLSAAFFDAGTVLWTKGGTLAKQLKNKSTVFMQAKQAKAPGMLRFQFKAVDLVNAEEFGIFNKSHPFFELQRMRTSNKQVWDAVFRSAPVKNNLNPSWTPNFQR